MGELRVVPGFAEKVRAGVARVALRSVNRKPFEVDLLEHLPPEFRPAARAAFFRDWTPEEKRLGLQVEAFRQRIGVLSHGGMLSSLPSPKPGELSLDERGHSAGAGLVEASAERHAKTGVRPPGGLLLRRLVSETRSQSILELGTNTGFSGCYFLSASHQPELYTIEGSEQLCAIARINLSRFSSRFEVRHALFDEAITELVAAGRSFDCAFIDGQHEQLATLHYARRLRPLVKVGGMLVFDDIYWSHGMLAAWREVCASSGYAMTLDLGWKGVAVVGTEGQVPTRYDVCEYMGRPAISHPDR